MLKSIKKNWFLLGLISVFLVTLADSSGFFTNPGIYLKTHHGPDCVIVLIFFLSGLVLDTGRIREGSSDYRATLTALVLIFIIAPLLTLPFTLIPLDTGVIIGIFLVGAMPTTLSSGVIMTGAAGGNMAHALLITIIANSLAVFTIPVSLGLLIGLTGESRIVEIDQLPIMFKIATLVLLPLGAGMLTRRISPDLRRFLPYTAIISQIGILSMVWMALCSGRNAVVSNIAAAIPISAIIFFFHLSLIFSALFLTRLGGIKKGRRESVILMGGQKTLPLSVILQVSLFPEYGVALVVCVLHHIIHLIMDAFLTRYLRGKK